MTTFRSVVLAWGRPTCVALAMLLFAGRADAQFPAIFDSQGFEPSGNPNFNYSTTFPAVGPFAGTGILEGQPQVFGEEWKRTTDNPPNASTARVVANTPAIAGTGSQVVRVDKAANANERWSPALDGGFPTNRFICIAWDMRVEQTTPTVFGPLFGSEAYDSDGGFGQLSGLYVDASNGQVVYQDSGTGFLQVALDPSNPLNALIVPFGTWNNFMVELDFQTQSYKYIVNNVVIGMEGFIDGALTEFTDSTISAIAVPGFESALGTAYFDNYKVIDGPCIIPEPTGAALACCGMGWLIARRRTRSGKAGASWGA